MRQTAIWTVITLLLGGLACRQPAASPKRIPVTTTSAEARSAFLQARELLGNLRSTEALPLLDQALSKDPDFALAHLLRAQSAGSPNEFFSHLKSAMAAAGKVSEGERLWIQGMEAAASGNTQARGELYQKLVAAYPEDEQAHQILGVHYFSIQQFDAAIAEFRKASQLAPAFPPAYNQLGYALRAAGKDGEAEAAFRKYIELIPNEPNPHDSLAELLMKLGRFDESIQSYRKALSLNPQFLNAYRGIAAGLMYEDKHEEALAQLRKALDSASTDSERRQTIFAMAVCFTDQGKIKEALEQVSKLSELAAQRADKAAMASAASTRGDLLLKTGRTKEAREAFTTALDLIRQSTIPDATKKNYEIGSHANLALLACAGKDFATAAKEAEIARSGFEAAGNPNQTRGAQEVLGIIALQQKKYDDAIAHLNQANLQSPFVMFQLGKAHAGKKDADSARTWYRKAAVAYTLPDLDYALIRKQAQKASSQ